MNNNNTTYVCLKDGSPIVSLQDIRGTRVSRRNGLIIRNNGNTFVRILKNAAPEVGSLWVVISDKFLPNTGELLRITEHHTKRTGPRETCWLRAERLLNPRLLNPKCGPYQCQSWHLPRIAVCIATSEDAEMVLSMIRKLEGKRKRRTEPAELAEPESPKLADDQLLLQVAKPLLPRGTHLVDVGAWPTNPKVDPLLFPDREDGRPLFRLRRFLLPANEGIRSAVSIWTDRGFTSDKDMLALRIKSAIRDLDEMEQGVRQKGHLRNIRYRVVDVYEGAWRAAPADDEEPTNDEKPEYAASPCRLCGRKTTLLDEDKRCPDCETPSEKRMRVCICKDNPEYSAKPHSKNEADRGEKGTHTYHGSRCPARYILDVKETTRALPRGADICHKTAVASGEVHSPSASSSKALGVGDGPIRNAADPANGSGCEQDTRHAQGGTASQVSRSSYYVDPYLEARKNRHREHLLERTFCESDDGLARDQMQPYAGQADRVRVILEEHAPPPEIECDHGWDED